MKNAAPLLALAALTLAGACTPSASAPEPEAELSNSPAAREPNQSASFKAADLVGRWVANDEEQVNGVVDAGDFSISSFTEYDADGTFFRATFDNHPDYNFYNTTRGTWTLDGQVLTCTPTSTRNFKPDGSDSKVQPANLWAPTVEIVTSITPTELQSRDKDDSEIRFTYVKTESYPGPMNPKAWARDTKPKASSPAPAKS